MFLYMGLIEDLRKRYAQEGKGQHFEDGLSRAVDMITRQTSLSRSEATERLEVNDLNVLATIFEAAGCTGAKKTATDERSLHQRMYAEYRTMLDDASRKHTMAKEEGERMKRAAAARMMARERADELLKTQKNEQAGQP